MSSVTVTVELAVMVVLQRRQFMTALTTIATPSAKRPGGLFQCQWARALIGSADSVTRRTWARPGPGGRSESESLCDSWGPGWRWQWAVDPGPESGAGGPAAEVRVRVDWRLGRPGRRRTRCPPPLAQCSLALGTRMGKAGPGWCAHCGSAGPCHSAGGRLLNVTGTGQKVPLTFERIP